MSVNRRRFLYASLVGGAAALATRRRHALASACEPTGPFDPQAWCDTRGQGLLSTRTPQSGWPLRRARATTMSQWQSERVAYANAFRELIGPWPARPALAPTILGAHDDPDFTRYKVAYTSLPSESVTSSTITAWLFIPKGHPLPRPAIVTLHQTIPQGKDEPAGVDASLPWMNFAEYYARRGYITLAPDAIGYGERTIGCYAETGFELADAWPILRQHPQMTLLGLMLFDTVRALDYLSLRPEVDPARIGVMGHSLGGVLTNCVLGLEPRFRVGVASCGYGIFRTDAYFERWAGSQSAYVPRLHLYRIDRNALPLDFLQIMALAAPAAHLVQTAMADTIWTPTAVALNPMVSDELRRIHGFYGSADTFVTIEPGGIEKYYKDHGWYPETQVASDELLARVLRP